MWFGAANKNQNKFVDQSIFLKVESLAQWHRQ